MDTNNPYLASYTSIEIKLAIFAGPAMGPDTDADIESLVNGGMSDDENRPTAEQLLWSGAGGPGGRAFAKGRERTSAEHL